MSIDHLSHPIEPSALDKDDPKTHPNRRWHQVIGANIGSMIISEDMAQGIRYCVHWLQVRS